MKIFLNYADNRDTDTQHIRIHADQPLKMGFSNSVGLKRVNPSKSHFKNLTQIQFFLFSWVRENNKYKHVNFTEKYVKDMSAREKKCFLLCMKLLPFIANKNENKKSFGIKTFPQTFNFSISIKKMMKIKSII